MRVNLSAISVNFRFGFVFRARLLDVPEGTPPVPRLCILAKSKIYAYSTKINSHKLPRNCST